MHEHMVFSVQELEEKSSMSDKVTAILATCQAPIKPLMWAISSLLLRSDPTVLEHIIVSINGPDSRTGDPSLQDQKQRMLEDVRSLRWHGRDMPLTIQRTWSRIGHTQAMEAAIPWVHTEFYVIMHDDVMVLDASWCKDFLEFSKNKEAAILYDKPLLLMGVHKKLHEGKWKLALPHLNSAFLVCRKSIFHQLGLRWWGYHIKEPIHIDKSFSSYHVVRDHLAIDDNRFFSNNFGLQAYKLHRTSKDDIEGDYDYFNLDIGSWVYYRLLESGCKFIPLRDNLVYHFKSASWNNKTYTNGINQSGTCIEDLEKILKYQNACPGLFEVYEKYL